MFEQCTQNSVIVASNNIRNYKLTHANISPTFSSLFLVIILSEKSVLSLRFPETNEIKNIHDFKLL